MTAAKAKARKSKEKGSDEVCLRSGKEGHVKHNCGFKDEKRSPCGKVSHLKAVCRSSGANQVETEDAAKQGAVSANAVWATALAQTKAKDVSNDNEAQAMQIVGTIMKSNNDTYERWLSEWLLTTRADVHATTLDE